MFPIQNTLYPSVFQPASPSLLEHGIFSSSGFGFYATAFVVEALVEESKPLYAAVADYLNYFRTWWLIFHFARASFVPFRGMYYITLIHYLKRLKSWWRLWLHQGSAGLKQKLIPLIIFPCWYPPQLINRPSKTTQVRVLNFDSTNLPHFLGFPFLCRQLS